MTRDFRRIPLEPGERFGRWTVIDDLMERGSKWRAECRCDCGTIRKVGGAALRRGDSPSCGKCSRRVGPIRRAHGTMFEKFMDSVDRRGDAECWPWLGRKSTRGYGQWNINYSDYIAHKWLYEHVNGPVPEGLELDHLCRNRSCVNPGHLEPVTHVENLRRARIAKTSCKNGHPLPAPTEDGKRRCRQCKAEGQRRYRARKRDRGADA